MLRNEAWASFNRSHVMNARNAFWVERLTFKAYIDNIKIKTGKSPADFMALAKKKGFVKDGRVVVKHGEVLEWIKSEFALGHGHANAIVFYLRDPEWAKKKIAKDTKNEKAK